MLLELCFPLLAALLLLELGGGPFGLLGARAARVGRVRQAPVHAVVVLLAATDDFPRGIEPIFIFADVFDPTKSQLEGMRRLFEVPNFVAEEWPHVLIWDLFVGRLIWLDGVDRDIVCWHSLLLTNFIGPPGLLLHAATSALSGKGLPTLGGAAEDAS